jgi:hypothetical protein
MSSEAIYKKQQEELKKGEEGGDKEGGNWACGGPLPDPTHPHSFKW